MTTDPSLTPEQIDALKAQFDLLDQDGDGRISRQELSRVLDREAYDHLGEAGRQRVRESFAAADADGDQALDFDEYLALVTGQSAEQDPQAPFREQFEQMDRDGDGYLTAEDFKRISEDEGESLSTEQAQAMIEMADANGNGKVSFDEYYKIMTGG